MKLFLTLFVGLCMGLVLGRVFNGVPATAASGGGQGGGVATCAAENGDVNADGRVDLSDAVTVLGYLFQGQPRSLLPLCAQPAAPSGLPDSGQTACYGLDGARGWVEVPCAEAVCQGQDASYATGCPSEGRFVDNGDGTVTDTCTGLMWQKETADVNGDGQSTDVDFVPWCDALRYCESLELAGHDDWRLPNVRELQSIVDYGRVDPAIDPVFGALSSVYWSSTSFAGSPDVALLVHFIYGLVGGDAKAKDVSLYVRAVRSGP
jgi:hypothetical protein